MTSLQEKARTAALLAFAGNKDDQADLRIVVADAVAKVVLEEVYRLMGPRIHGNGQVTREQIEQLLESFGEAEPPDQGKASISVERLEGEWEGDQPSYVVSDDREGIVLCICWLPDVAERIQRMLQGEAVPQGEQTISRATLQPQLRASESAQRAGH